MRLSYWKRRGAGTRRKPVNMDVARACPECLRRAHLLAHLAPYIEEHVTGDLASLLPPLLRLDDEDLATVVAPEVASRVLEAIASVPEEHLYAELTEVECWSCCRHNHLFPPGLRDTPEAPRALIGGGDPSLLDRLSPGETVTVVGARRASAYGRKAARGLGRELAGDGLAVVSGLTFGIDACAHRGALEGGLTVAVLGCGPDVSYPAAHRSLRRWISEGGLVVSELPPGCGAWRWTLLARARIMAALAGMTVVVEATECSSSLKVAGLAAKLDRDLGAVPGPIDSRLSIGSNNLLASGACVVRNAQSVLDTMQESAVPGMKRDKALNDSR
jgi:DNA processing protein